MLREDWEAHSYSYSSLPGATVRHVGTLPMKRTRLLCVAAASLLGLAQLALLALLPHAGRILSLIHI